MTTRREFLRGSLAAAASTAALAARLPAHVAGTESYRVGLIGCGNRGVDALRNCLEASSGVRLAALADVLPDRLASGREQLESIGEAGQVDDEHCFVGFDAYQSVLAAEVDLVILATPPHFRPEHLSAAVDAGKHVFMEKPVAVDPVGVRKVLAAAERAKEKGLTIVAGTQRRYHLGYRETIRRIHEGAIGEIVSAECAWNQGGIWMLPREPEWSDMEWQLRNWPYFTWLSGDHIVSRHMHNIDVINWVLGTHPERAWGTGGRQVRTDPAYGNVYDHFAVTFEYPNGVRAHSSCRQIDGCANWVGERVVGTRGTADPAGRIDGEESWEFQSRLPDPYVQEHYELIESIRDGLAINDGRQVAESTLTAIMGRIASYTGRTVTWDEVLQSDLDLTPPSYSFGDLAVRPVAMPGKEG